MAVLRLTFPQWQGGVNPNYVFGSELLAAIAPQDSSAESVVIQVDKNYDKSIERLDGVDCGASLLTQMQKAREVLDIRRPDKVIVFGGDCAVTQVPFDYLHGKYGDEIGILWLDAHPDCSTTRKSQHIYMRWFWGI